MMNPEVRLSIDADRLTSNDIIEKANEETAVEQNSKRLSEMQTSDFDYVMVFAADKKKEVAAHFQKKLIVNGKLIVKEQMSRDGDEVFLLITASERDFERVAEAMELKKKLRPEYNGAHAKFKVDKREKFELTHDGKLFTSYEKATIIQHIIAESAKIDILQKLNDGELLKCFPLHEKERVQYFLREYLSGVLWKPVDKKIIHEIRNYFGSYVAIYFGWLLHYTKYLIGAAVVGVILFIIEMATGWGVDNQLAPFYSVFIALWATIYIEFWKRRNSEIAMEWDMTDFEMKETVLASFTGEERPGVYIDGVFVSLDNYAPKDEASNKPTPVTAKTPLSMSFSSAVLNHAMHDRKVPTTIWAPEGPRFAKMGVGLSVSVTFAVIAIIATLSIFVFKLFINKLISTVGGIIGGVVNAVIIMVLNMIYRKVAVTLTNWENHRTTQEYENTLIVKNFIFQFVNSYISLFYIAFMKGRVQLFGYKDKDQCVPNCMSELEIQLATIFLTQIFVQQFNEVAIPFIKQKVMLWLEGQKMQRQQHLHVVTPPTEAEIESKLTEYDSTFDDYNEMAIQFGYVTLFAVAFPLAPLAALLNNFVEARTDLLKLVKGMQRPRPKEAADIGTWLRILEIISYLAVLTNCAMIVWTSQELNKYDESSEHSLSMYNRLMVGLILEHGILVVKFILSEFIPDSPGWVREAVARKTYVRQLVLEDAIKQKKIYRQSLKLQGNANNSPNSGPVVVQPQVPLDEDD